MCVNVILLWVSMKEEIEVLAWVHMLELITNSMLLAAILIPDLNQDLYSLLPVHTIVIGFLLTIEYHSDGFVRQNSLNFCLNLNYNS